MLVSYPRFLHESTNFAHESQKQYGHIIEQDYDSYAIHSGRPTGLGISKPTTQGSFVTLGLDRLPLRAYSNFTEIIDLN